MNFLHTVGMELEQLDVTKLSKELAEPQFPVEKQNGEKIVGEVEEDTRKLWILYTVWAKLSMETVVEARFCGNKKQSAELLNRAVSLGKKSELLSEIFWASVKDALDLWGHNGSVGIRAGWKVVTTNPEEPPFLASLRDLFGGM